MILRELQGLLARLYDAPAEHDVADFLITDAQHAAALQGRAQPPTTDEQLLVSETEGMLELSLYVDEHVLQRLLRRCPLRELDDSNLADYCTALEGVSHFHYLVWSASHARPVSLLELELQAEVDKYVTCHLMGYGDGLREQLFERSTLLQDLSAEERERYRMANDCAYAYTGHLERRYVRQRRLDAMLLELRRFWRAGLHDKLRSIRAATH